MLLCPPLFYVAVHCAVRKLFVYPKIYARCSVVATVIVATRDTDHFRGLNTYFLNGHCICCSVFDSD